MLSTKIHLGYHAHIRTLHINVTPVLQFFLLLWGNGKVGIRFSIIYAHNKIISRYPISWNVAQGSKYITSYVRIRIVNILPYLWSLLIWKCFTKKKKVQNQIEWHKHAVEQQQQQQQCTWLVSKGCVPLQIAFPKQQNPASV